MSDPIGAIFTSPRPEERIRGDDVDALFLEQLTPRIFSSIFSSYVPSASERWYERLVDAALARLSEQRDSHAVLDLLLEIAFHGNLGLRSSDGFFDNLGLIENVLTKTNCVGAGCSGRYVEGLLSYAHDDLVAAEKAFISLPSVGEGPLLSYQAPYPAFRAPAFYRTLVNSRDSGVGLDLDFVQHPKRALDDTSSVMLCSADAVYFKAFAEDFAASVFEVSESTNIHFHLINVEDPYRLTGRHLLDNARVSVTVEHTDLSKPDWYAIAARYIVLPRILEEWNRPVVVSDIDLVVRDDPRELDDSHPVVLGISRHPAADYIPSTKILGGHNRFVPSSLGIEFARMLSRYMQLTCADERGVWVADQIALLMVWRMLRSFVPVGSFDEVRSYGYGPSPERSAKKERAAAALASLGKAV